MLESLSNKYSKNQFEKIKNKLSQSELDLFELLTKGKNTFFEGYDKSHCHKTEFNGVIDDMIIFWEAYKNIFSGNQGDNFFLQTDYMYRKYTTSFFHGGMEYRYTEEIIYELYSKFIEIYEEEQDYKTTSWYDVKIFKPASTNLDYFRTYRDNYFR